MTKPPATPGVYVIQAGDRQIVKIGKAKNIASRMADLQCTCPDDLRFLGCLSTNPGDETRWHKRFASLRIRGEWFRLEQVVKDFLRDPGEPSRGSRTMTHSAVVSVKLPDDWGRPHLHKPAKIRWASDAWRITVRYPILEQRHRDYEYGTGKRLSPPVLEEWEHFGVFLLACHDGGHEFARNEKAGAERVATQMANRARECIRARIGELRTMVDHEEAARIVWRLIEEVASARDVQMRRLAELRFGHPCNAHGGTWDPATYLSRWQTTDFDRAIAPQSLKEAFARWEEINASRRAVRL